MWPVFVFVHSPSVGPLTWKPVAERLDDSGWDTVVPSLLHIADGDPPFWPRVAEAVTGALRGVGSGRSVILVPHSNAGYFVPVVAEMLWHPLAGCVFVDAGIPERAGETALAPPELLALLRDKAVEGLLPPWTDWFGETEVAWLFPDDRTRRAVTAEQPRLPLSFYEQSIPVPGGWDQHPCAYLQFAPPYGSEAAEARRRGWVVERLPGGHLHMVVDPDEVCRRLISLAGRLL